MSKIDTNSHSLIPSAELIIVPLEEHQNLLSFNCENSELNDFLKNDALSDQNDLITRTSLCLWKNELTGFVALVADTIEAKAVPSSHISNYQTKTGFPLKLLTTCPLLVHACL